MNELKAYSQAIEKIIRKAKKKNPKKNWIKISSEEIANKIIKVTNEIIKEMR